MANHILIVDNFDTATQSFKVHPRTLSVYHNDKVFIACAEDGSWPFNKKSSVTCELFSGSTLIIFSKLPIIQSFGVGPLYSVGTISTNNPVISKYKISIKNDKSTYICDPTIIVMD